MAALTLLCVVASRGIFTLIAFGDVRSGRDPKHIIGHPGQNGMVHIDHNEERELLGALQA